MSTDSVFGMDAGDRLFNARERAVIAFADAVTKDVQAGDTVFDEARPFFGERQIVELTVLIASYNKQSRVLEALELRPPQR